MNSFKPTDADRLILSSIAGKRTLNVHWTRELESELFEESYDLDDTDSKCVLYFGTYDGEPWSVRLLR